MIDFDRTPFAQAREDIRDLVWVPIQAWMLIPPPRRRGVAYDNIVSIPIDLAAADFAVTVSQTDLGWVIDVEKMLAPRVHLHLAGQARSLVSAFFQLADSADHVLRDLERQARARHLKDQGSEVAA